jgi:hypothetical protein
VPLFESATRAAPTERLTLMPSMSAIGEPVVFRAPTSNGTAMRTPSALTYSRCPSNTPSGDVPATSRTRDSRVLSDITAMRAPLSPCLGQLT